MAETWIIVHNWEKWFQYRADRPPIWIQNHVALLHDDDYLGLTLAQRGVLHGLWLMYAASRQQVPKNTSRITRQLGVKVSERTLIALRDAGFIEFSGAKPAPIGRLEEKKRETPKPPSEKGAKETQPKTKRRKAGVTGWREVRGTHGIDYVPDPNGHAKPPYSVPFSDA